MEVICALASLPPGQQHRLDPNIRPEQASDVFQGRVDRGVLAACCVLCGAPERVLAAPYRIFPSFGRLDTNHVILYATGSRAIVASLAHEHFVSPLTSTVILNGETLHVRNSLDPEGQQQVPASGSAQTSDATEPTHLLDSARDCLAQGPGSLHTYTSCGTYLIRRN